MTLRDLMGDGAPEVEVTGLAYRSTDVAPGTLFFCVPGFTADGHDFAPDAVQRGAGAPLHRVGSEVVPVGREARNAEEERPGSDVRAPVCEPRDLDLRGPVAHEVAQGHGGRDSRAASGATRARSSGTAA